jgi:hypothetical protein
MPAAAKEYKPWFGNLIDRRGERFAMQFDAY